MSRSSSTLDNRHASSKRLHAGLAEARAEPSIASDWAPLQPPPIEGVEIREVKNVVYRNGHLTELFRPEWFDGKFRVEHVVLVTMLPGQTSQWHCHHRQGDVIFPVRGYLRIGLYDARPGSSTCGQSHVGTYHLLRPRYLVVPTGVWHALKNVGQEECAYVVLNDQPYAYEAPDDWVLPPGAPAIPVRLD